MFDLENRYRDEKNTKHNSLRLVRGTQNGDSSITDILRTIHAQDVQKQLWNTKYYLFSRTINNTEITVFVQRNETILEKQVNHPQALRLETTSTCDGMPQQLATMYHNDAIVMLYRSPIAGTCACEAMHLLLLHSARLVRMKQISMSKGTYLCNRDGPDRQSCEVCNLHCTTYKKNNRLSCIRSKNHSRHNWDLCTSLPLGRVCHMSSNCTSECCGPMASS